MLHASRILRTANQPPPPFGLTFHNVSVTLSSALARPNAACVLAQPPRATRRHERFLPAQHLTTADRTQPPKRCRYPWLPRLNTHSGGAVRFLHTRPPLASNPWPRRPPFKSLINVQTSTNSGTFTSPPMSNPMWATQRFRMHEFHGGAVKSSSPLGGLCAYWDGDVGIPARRPRCT